MDAIAQLPPDRQGRHHLLTQNVALAAGGVAQLVLKYLIALALVLISVAKLAANVTKVILESSIYSARPSSLTSTRVLLSTGSS